MLQVRKSLAARQAFSFFLFGVCACLHRGAALSKMHLRERSLPPPWDSFCDRRVINWLQIPGSLRQQGKSWSCARNDSGARLSLFSAPSFPGASLPPAHRSRQTIPISSLPPNPARRRLEALAINPVKSHPESRELQPQPPHYLCTRSSPAFFLPSRTFITSYTITVAHVTAIHTSTSSTGNPAHARINTPVMAHG
jgi:hypothetical protein